MVKCRLSSGLLGLVICLAPLMARPAIADSWTMKEGDTLWDIARITYGDPSFWTDLARANSISNPRTIPNGTVITLPSKATLLKLRGVTDPAERARILAQDAAGTPSASAGPTGPSAFDPMKGLGSRVQVPKTGAPPSRP